MDKRTISVELRANVADFKQQMRSAASSLEDAVKRMDKTGAVAQTRLGRLAQSAMFQRDSWNQVGNSLLALGTAAVGGLGVAVKAAIDWQAAWTGVTKTVDGSAEQMAQLEGDLRGLATVLPATHEEIAAVAESAGQLGVKVGDVRSFTKTMIDLGETTNLSAEQAATGIARLYNIMGQKNSEARKFGDVIVDLGNNFATTESEILDFSLRMAAAGRQAGMSTADVAAYGAALSSVGVEAEAGGTAMSKLFTDIGDSVRSGGKELETYAKLAGVSANEFQQMFSNNAAESIAKVVGGFGDLSKAGANTSEIFQKLHLNDARLKRSVLSMGQAVDQTLIPALRKANEQWEKGGALSAEANKRYATDQAKIKIAFNELKDTAISFGADIAPIVSSTAKGIGSLVHAFTQLPGPVKTSIGALAGIIGTSALVGGALLKIIPAVLEARKALESLGIMSALTDSKLGKLAASGLGSKIKGFAGKVGRGAMMAGVAAAGAGFTAHGVKYVTDKLRGVEYVDDSLEKVSNRLATAKASASQFDVVLGDLTKSGEVAGYGMENLSSAIAEVNHKGLAGRVLVDMVGIPSANGVEYVEERFKTLSKVMATMADTDAPRAQKQFKAMLNEMGGGTKNAEELFQILPEYKKALTAQATAAGLSADSQTLLKIATGELSVTMDETTGKAKALSKSQEEIDRVSGKLYDQFGRLKPATKEAVQEADKYVQSLQGLSNIDISKNAEKGLNAWIKSLKEQQKAVADWQTNMLTLSASGLSKTALDALVKMGPQAGGRIADELAKAMSDKSKFAELSKTLESTIGESAASSASTFASTFAASADKSDAQAVLKAAFTKLGAAGVAEVQAKFEEGMSAWEINKEMKLGLNLDSTPADQSLEMLKAKILESKPIITLNGNILPAEVALQEVLTAIKNGKEAITINGKTMPAQEALAQIIQDVYKADPAMTVKASTDLASNMITALKSYANQDANFRVNANKGGDYVSDWKKTLSQGISFSVRALTAGATASIRSIFTRAHGGPIIGPGTSRSDSIPAMLSNGEHVIPADEVAKAGGQAGIERIRRMIRSGQRFATGGPVGRPIPIPVASSASSPALTVYVTNPFTGEQVQARMRAEAVNQILEGQRIQ